MKYCFNHFNKKPRLGVRVFLKNKIVFSGFMIDSIIENGEIKAWQFVSNNNAIEYQKTKDPKLVHVIEHADIENVENL